MTLRQRMEVVDVDEGSLVGISLIDSKTRDGKHQVHAVFGVALIGFLAMLFALVYYIDGIGPTPLKISDEDKYPDAFIAERAKNILTSLTDIGPRIVGSPENEVLAVSIIKRHIEHVQQNANRAQQIELDIQTTSGSYFLGYQPYGSVNAYLNVQNVVVRIKGSSNSSILINAHFDTVPTSPGASDDGIMCAIMLEILEKLSKLPDRPTHDLIFLFNGAEETMLQASHGFITQHKWASTTKVLINLEAGGSGHKAILFQTGPKVPWLLSYYNRVPHPFGQAAGEELFQSNIIPSDTDFRIFRDFGSLVGYDIAFARNGYRYHTKYDAIEYIPLWSYQHTGDNVLTLIRQLSDAPEVENPGDTGEGTNVYFDFFGLFMIAYSQLIAIILNLIIVLISILLAVVAFRDFGQGLRWRTYKYILIVYGCILTGWILSLFVYFLIAIILDAFGRTMSWFTNSWLVFGLYSAPVMAITFGSMHLIHRFGKQDNLSVSIQIQMQIHLMRLIWTIILFVGTVSGIRSVYAIMVPILFNVIYFILLKIFKWQYSITLWQILYVISTIIPTMMLMYESLQVANFLIPISGRIGSNRNPELILGAVYTFLTIVVTSYYAPLIGIFKKPYITLGPLVLAFIATIICVATPIGFPYSDSSVAPTPQRFMIHHMSRIFRDEKSEVITQDSGIFFYNMDRNSPDSIRDYVPELENTTSNAAFCELYLACGLPLSSPRMLASIDYSTWIPFEKPKYLDPVTLKMTSKVANGASTFQFSFIASGPDHSTVFFKPKNGATIIASSLAEVSGPDLVYVNYVQGTPAPLQFTVDVEYPSNYSTGPLIDVAISGRYVHSKVEKLNQEFRRFCKSFPSWADVMPAVASYESFVF